MSLYRGDKDAIEKIERELNGIAQLCSKLIADISKLQERVTAIERKLKIRW